MRNGANKVGIPHSSERVYSDRSAMHLCLCGRGLTERIERRNVSMNIFRCRQGDVWQCGRDDCAVNFTLQTSDIAVVLRDDQQPNAINAVQFADPNAKFITTSPNASSIDTPTSAPAASYHLSAAAKAGIAVGAAVGGALAVLGTFLYFGSFSRHGWFVRGKSKVSAKEAVFPKTHRGFGSELAGQPALVELDSTGAQPELMAQTPKWEMESGH